MSLLNFSNVENKKMTEMRRCVNDWDNEMERLKHHFRFSSLHTYDHHNRQNETKRNNMVGNRKLLWRCEIMSPFLVEPSSDFRATGWSRRFTYSTPPSFNRSLFSLYWINRPSLFLRMYEVFSKGEQEDISLNHIVIPGLLFLLFACKKQTFRKILSWRLTFCRGPVERVWGPALIWLRMSCTFNLTSSLSTPHLLQLSRIFTLN